MSLVINTNTSSINAQRNYATNAAKLDKSIERMASGYRINRSGDDAAGLDVSEELRGQMRGTRKALENVQDGINLLKVVDGALVEIGEILQKIRELTVQNANETNSLAEHDAINQEINQLRENIWDIAHSTQFNGVYPITWNSATLYANFTIQAGPNETAQDEIDLSSIMGRMDPAGGGGLNLTPSAVVNNNMAHDYLFFRVDPAMEILNERRGRVGALINRLEGTAGNLQINLENLSATESRIRDVDFAQENATIVQHQVIQQATSSVLTQANQTPNLALQLISQSS